MHRLDRAAAGWRDRHPGIVVEVLTVDHRLRPGSEAAADRVLDVAGRLGMAASGFGVLLALAALGWSRVKRS